MSVHLPTVLKQSYRMSKNQAGGVVGKGVAARENSICEGRRW